MKRRRDGSAPEIPPVGRRFWQIGALIVALLFATAMVVMALRLPSGFAPRPQEASPFLAPAREVLAADGLPDPRTELPALPPVPYALPRPFAVVLAAYEFAARHPEVLRSMPCFCGCEHIKHGSNHDCFVSARDREGRVTWDAHGASCGLCIDVARDAMRLYAAGRPLVEIRAEIERTHGSRSSNRTPTAPVS